MTYKVTGKLIVVQARTWMDTRYHHQGRLKKSAAGPGGVDCIGLVVGVADELGLQDGAGNPISRADETDYSMYPERGRLVRCIERYLRPIPLERMAEGDVLLFRTFNDPQHVGLLTHYPTGGLGLIHCNSSAGRVVEQPLSDTWRRMLTHAYRFTNKQLQPIK